MLTETTECLTSIRHQQRHQVCLLFGENFDEFLEVINTSPSKKLEKFIVTVTWLYNVDNVLSLWPRDTSDRTKLSDKCMVGVNAIQQLNTIHSQRPHPSCIQRSHITVISSNICTLSKTFINLLNLA